MGRYSRYAAIVAAMGFFALAGPAVYAGDVVIDISGKFGEFGYGNQPAPLNDGYFSGTVTFSALPDANSTVISSTADVNFYDSSHTLLFTPGGRRLRNDEGRRHRIHVPCPSRESLISVAAHRWTLRRSHSSSKAGRSAA